MIVVNQLAALGFGRQPRHQVPDDHHIGVRPLDFPLQQKFAQELRAAISTAAINSWRISGVTLTT